VERECKLNGLVNDQESVAKLVALEEFKVRRLLK